MAYDWWSGRLCEAGVRSHTPLKLTSQPVEARSEDRCEGEREGYQKRQLGTDWGL